MLNYTLQDVSGAFLAFFLFFFVIVTPGYTLGWALNLFDFRKRSRLPQLALGLCLSFGVTPILLYLTSSLISQPFSLLLLGGFAVTSATIMIKDRRPFTREETRLWKPLFWLTAIWTIFVILSLVDIEWNGQSFFSVVSYDQATRVSIIEAITRTGVPPVNPSYYPGYPVKLTFLYYFWYIVASYVDLIGGRFVDAFAALTASSVWSGLGLMAVIALYLQQREAKFAVAAWRYARLGIGLLAVSGLDVIPIIILMARTGTIVGSVDVWNTWIPAWLSSNLWVPHHVAALIAGLVAMMLAHSARGKSAARQWSIMAIAGMAFASALGLSVYVTLIFALFWIAWILALFLQKTNPHLVNNLNTWNSNLRSSLLSMIFAGIVALILASPFLVGLLKAGGGARSFPIVFEVRSFLQLESFVKNWSPLSRELVMLAALPFNYLLELGFFFVASLIWLQQKRLKGIGENPFFLAEGLLLGSAFLVGSFLRSTLITSNDLGWRAWLPGQFILLVWGVDVLAGGGFSIVSKDELRARKLLQVFLVLGVLTTITDAILLRTAWPIMTGKEQTERYFSARPAYEYLRQQLPADKIIQNNPNNPLDPDRPSGLYGAHQMVVANRTAYGIPTKDFVNLSNTVEALFEDRNTLNWSSIDILCNSYFIDVLIINDADPIWNSFFTLQMQRAALFENDRYAIFACGNFAQTQ